VFNQSVGVGLSTGVRTIVARALPLAVQPESRRQIDLRQHVAVEDDDRLVS
jgi:hypothetical protein